MLPILVVLHWLHGLHPAAEMLVSSLLPVLAKKPNEPNEPKPCKPCQPCQPCQPDVQVMAFACVHRGSGIPIGHIMCRPLVQLVYQAVESMLAKLDKQHPAKCLAVDKFLCWIDHTNMLDILTNDQLANQQHHPHQPHQPGLVGLPRTLALAPWTMSPATAKLAAKLAANRANGRVCCKDVVMALRSLGTNVGYAAYQALVPVACLNCHTCRKLLVPDVMAMCVDRHDRHELLPDKHKYAMMLAKMGTNATERYILDQLPTSALTRIVRIGNSLVRDASHASQASHTHLARQCCMLYRAAVREYSYRERNSADPATKQAAWDDHLVESVLEGLCVVMDQSAATGACQTNNDDNDDHDNFIWFSSRVDDLRILLETCMPSCVPPRLVVLAVQTWTKLNKTACSMWNSHHDLLLWMLQRLLRNAIQESSEQAQQAVQAGILNCIAFELVRINSSVDPLFLVAWLATHQPVQLCQSGVFGKLLHHAVCRRDRANLDRSAYPCAQLVRRADDCLVAVDQSFKLVNSLVPSMDLATKAELVKQVSDHTEWMDYPAWYQLVASLVISHPDVGKLFFWSTSWKRLVCDLGADTTTTTARTARTTRTARTASQHKMHVCRLCEFLLVIKDHNTCNDELQAPVARLRLVIDAKPVVELYNWLCDTWLAELDQPDGPCPKRVCQ